MTKKIYKLSQRLRNLHKCSSTPLNEFNNTDSRISSLQAEYDDFSDSGMNNGSPDNKGINAANSRPYVDQDPIASTTGASRTLSPSSKTCSLNYKTIFLIATFICLCILSVWGALKIYQIYTTAKFSKTEIVSVQPSDDRFAGYYGYNLLTPETQLIYSDIYDTITTHADSVTLSTVSEDAVTAAYEAYRADHGEVFWSSGYSLRKHTVRNKVVQLDFLPTYTMEQETIDFFQEKIDAAVSDILFSAPRQGSDYDKLKYVYDYIASNISYSIISEENQNIISVFLYHKSVCRGYAAALQYLLRQLDIESTIITGSVDGIAHAWNLVYLNGKYYYTDATLGDVSYDDINGPVCYAYMAMTSAECEKEHISDVLFPLPDCTSNIDSFYVKEGLLFSDFDITDISTICSSAYAKGNRSISFKFLSDSAYRLATYSLIENDELTTHCPEIPKFQFYSNEGLRVLTICF